MAQQGRYFRPKPKCLQGTPYDSMTEKRLHEGAFKDLNHHPPKIHYVWPHEYEPDFIHNKGDGNIIYVEIKGYFMDRKDCTKYLWVRDSLCEHEELVFVFEKPSKPMHFQSKRKDGTKMTHGEWCEKNGFRYFSEEDACQVISL